MIELVKPEELEHPRTPRRRANSLRRTATMHMTWPEGYRGPLLLRGRARDIHTFKAGERPHVLLEDSLEARVENGKELTALWTNPARAELAALVGMPPIKGYRRRLADLVQGRADRERPLDMLLDDIAAASLVSGWVLTQWPDSPLYDFRHNGSSLARMEGTCTGFRPGSSALEPARERMVAAEVAPLQLSDDPDGWHEFFPAPAIEMRRSRRLDLWREDGQIRIDSMFQDSGIMPDGVRRAVHDYGLRALVDPASWTITALDAQARILPAPECPGAVANIQRIVGMRLEELRPRVLDDLAGVAGCTHLNDAIRALASAHRLAAALDAAEAATD